MAFKCTNDGVEFQSREELVNHMIEKYNSPFIDGEDNDKNVILSRKILEKKVQKEPQNQELAKHIRRINTEVQ